MTRVSFHGTRGKQRADFSKLLTFECYPNAHLRKDVSYYSIVDAVLDLAVVKKPTVQLGPRQSPAKAQPLAMHLRVAAFFALHKRVTSDIPPPLQHLL